MRAKDIDSVLGLLNLSGNFLVAAEQELKMARGAQILEQVAQTPHPIFDAPKPFDYEGFYTRALYLAEAWAKSGDTFTSDDVRHSYQDDSPPDPRIWGVVMLKARAAGLVVPVDRYVVGDQVTAPINHHRPMRLWKGADA